jgi:hypothetical protein
MENFNYLSINNIDTSDSKIINMCKYLLYSIPIFSSIICSVYLILLFNKFIIVSNNLKNINNLIVSLNITELSMLTSNLILLEDCVLTKLQIC